MGERLLLFDPGLLRLTFSARAVLGLVLVALAGWFVAEQQALALSGVMLGVVASQFTLLMARQPARKKRIITSLVMIPGYWVGLVLIHLLAAHPQLQVLTLPLLIGLGFWLEHNRPQLATAVMATAWIFVFSVYFQAQAGPLLWHMVAATFAVLVMMAVRFLIWRDDRPIRRNLILRSQKLLLIRAAKRAASAHHIADVIGQLHTSIEPIIRSLEDHPDFDSATLKALSDQRFVVETELIQSPERGADIARILLQNCDAGREQISPSMARLHQDFDGHRSEPRAEANPGNNPTAKAAKRRAIQVTAAVALAAVAGFLVSPERWPWAVLVSMFMFFGTESSGRLLSKGLQNVIGVLLGLVLGAFLSYLISPTLWLELTAIMAMTFLAFYLIPVHYALGMAAVTALIALAFTLGGDNISMVLALRAGEVFVGAFFGLAAGLLVMPERGSLRLRRAAAQLLHGIASTLDSDAEAATDEQLRDSLNAVYTAADFGPIEGLFIDGSQMRTVLVELARLQHLASLRRHLPAQSRADIQPDYLRQLAESCRAVAAHILDQKHAAPEPLAWPEGDSHEVKLLAAIDASLTAITMQS